MAIGQCGAIGMVVVLGNVEKLAIKHVPIHLLNSVEESARDPSMDLGMNTNFVRNVVR